MLSKVLIFVSKKLAKAKDQLMPLYIMDVFKNLPGMPGLFVAGIFSAALSSLSSALNSLAAIALEDFIKPKIDLTEWQTNIFMRCFVVICGIVCVCLVFIVEKLGPVLQLVFGIVGSTQGPLLGMFVMGVMMPWTNGKNVFTGGITAMLLMTGVMLKQQSDVASGLLEYELKPMSTNGCWYDFDKQNVTINNTDSKYDFRLFFSIHNSLNIFFTFSSTSVFHFSYLYVTLFGVLLTILISHASMIYYGRQDLNKIDMNLLAPFVRKRIKISSKAVQIELENKEIKTINCDDEEEVPSYTEFEEKQPLSKG